MTRLRLILLLPILASMTAVVAFAPAAGAHTEFESSDPGDGAVLADPVSTVTIVFTAVAEPTGDGFQVLDPSGAIRDPTTVSSPDGRTWVLEFGEPLAGGTVGVRWMVKAGDAHPIDGSFSFTAGDVSEETPGSTEPPTTASPGVGPEPDDPVGRVEPDDPGPADELETFLADGDQGDIAGALDAVGRVARLLGAVVGLGALVFVSHVLRGGRNDSGRVLMWIRRCSALAVAGTVIAFFASVARGAGGGGSALVSASAYGDLVVSSLGLSLALSVAGGVALGLGSTTPHEERAVTGAEAQRWRPNGLAAVGAVLLLASFLFDGHTVTEGNRVLTAIADVVHVGTAAIWAGGVAMLATVVRHRRSRGGSEGVAVLSARFSVVAAYSLAAAGLTGIALAVTVLDTPSELWSSSWGRLLLLKVALVCAAVAAGAYNHFVLVPALEADGDDPSTLQRFRKVLGGEAGLLLAVIVVTGILVGAST